MIVVVLATNFAPAANRPALAVDEETTRAWPELRGAYQNGHANAKLPLTWSDSQNVQWRTAIHDRGWSSPVVIGNRIWVTSSTVDGKKLFGVCLDVRSGKVIHDLHLFDVEKPQFVAPSNSFASPTPAVDSQRAYLHFGTNGTACVDNEAGKVLWTRRDLNCDHEQGAGSSPMLYDDRLIVHVDGRDTQYIIALDKLTGETLWKTDRSADYGRYEVYQRKGYSMPILAPRVPKQQLISPAAKGVFAYDPETGAELWKVRTEGWSMAPRPLYGRGLAFVVVDYDHPQLWAIKPDGLGDVTDTHVAWKITKGIPSRPSFLLINGLLYLVTSDGIASCVEAETGEVVWKERIAGKYSASPIYADGRIYFFNEDSTTTVIKPGRKFEQLAVNKLGDEQLMASPAVAYDSLFIRTEHWLYRISSPRRD
ncbi:MAG TPA: PQQ-binding-like beta-propeller repeat protein [Pirellulaceae bacterium]|nr:PQQ-binding-like beta-propeller repeat protein [Pirellulaceae bacterium]